MTVASSEMLACYERAQALYRGAGSTKIARNSTIFPGWIGDTNCFWYVKELEDGREFRLVNAEQATNDVAFDHALLAELLGEKTGQSVDARNLPLRNVFIELAPLAVQFSAFGESWRYAEETQSLEVVGPYPKSWVISPDGQRAVFVRDHNLWVRELESGDERALTTDGEEFYDYGASSTLWGRPVAPGLTAQALWSPDGKTIFTLQKDRRQVKTLPVVHHIPADGGLRPQLKEHKVAYPGDSSIEEYRLVMIDAQSGRQRPVDYARVPVVTNSNTGLFSHGYAWWGRDGREVYFIDIDRYSRRARVVGVDPASGATRIIIEETSDTHLAFSGNENLTHTMEILPDTNELIWYSERSGWAHFYLYDFQTGELKNAITAGEWRVRNSVRFDAGRRELFLTTSGRVEGRNPYYHDLVRVNIDTGEMATVAQSDHEYVVACPTSSTLAYSGHTGLCANDCNAVCETGAYAVATRSRVDTVPETVLFDRDGREIMVVEEADLSLPEGWVWPEPVQMKAADGKTDIYGVIFKPVNFDPGKSYPVIDSAMASNPITSKLAKGSFTNSGVYGGNFYPEAALAQLGFVVVQMDGRGTAYRSKAFHDESYGLPGEGNKIEDHVAGLQELFDAHPYMDRERVGVVSLTAGSGAAMGLLKYPDFFKVGAGIQIYDERLQPCVSSGDKFIGPRSWAPEMRALEDYASGFKGKLLQCVALAASTDSIAASSLRIINALQRANKNVDVVVETRHAYALTNYQMRRMWDHMVRHLLGVEPPEGFVLSGTRLDGNG